MSTLVAQRYAWALYERAREAGAVEAVDRDMEFLQGLLQVSASLVQMLRNPLISRERKVAVFERLLKGKVHDLVLGLIRLTVRKRREALLPEIVATYLHQRDERLGVLDVDLWLAAEVEAKELEVLKKALEAYTGKNVRLHVHTRPDLLGGVVVQIGDRVLDRSVRHQLERLKARLAGEE